MTISEKRLAEIVAIKDEDIDYSDIPELDERLWAKAELRMPDRKDRITIRNAILRQYYGCPYP